MTALEQMDSLYAQLLQATDTYSRQCLKAEMEDLMRHHYEVRGMWSFNPKQRYIKDQFFKIGGTLTRSGEGSPAEIPPMFGGLYLFGQTAFNPITRTPLFFIKVGQAKSFKDRCKQYKTHNPAVWRIEFLLVEDNTAKNGMETDCHAMLTERGLHHESENSTEWYEVSEELYTEICEKGFSYFFK